MVKKVSMSLSQSIWQKEVSNVNRMFLRGANQRGIWLCALWNISLSSFLYVDLFNDSMLEQIEKLTLIFYFIKNVTNWNFKYEICISNFNSQMVVNMCARVNNFKFNFKFVKWLLLFSDSLYVCLNTAINQIVRSWRHRDRFQMMLDFFSAWVTGFFQVFFFLEVVASIKENISTKDDQSMNFMSQTIGIHFLRFRIDVSTCRKFYFWCNYDRGCFICCRSARHLCDFSPSYYWRKKPSVQKFAVKPLC